MRGNRFPNRPTSRTDRHGQPVIGESEIPYNEKHTHSGLRVWVRVGGNIAKAAFDPMRDDLAAYRERQRPPQTWRRVPNLARQAKGSEGDLHRSDNLLCEQRRNQSRLPSRVGRQDANAVGWGSEVVIVVGVTSHQGARESRAQGEGPQNSMFQVNPRQAAVGRITKPISKDLPDEQCCGRNGTPVRMRSNDRGRSFKRMAAVIPSINHFPPRLLIRINPPDLS